jgi:hypothetical protein
MPPFYPTCRVPVHANVAFAPGQGVDHASPSTISVYLWALTMVMGSTPTAIFSITGHPSEGLDFFRRITIRFCLPDDGHSSIFLRMILRRLVN